MTSFKNSGTAHCQLKQKVNELFNITLKAEQHEALFDLTYGRTDLIVIAKTGFDKSILFQAAPLLTDLSDLCLILMPLKALQAEQCDKLQKVTGVRFFVLNDDTNTSHNLKVIKQGNYTHDM